MILVKKSQFQKIYICFSYYDRTVIILTTKTKFGDLVIFHRIQYFNLAINKIINEDNLKIFVMVSGYNVWLKYNS